MARTPVLLPSFSSKGFPDIKDIIGTTKEVLTEEILISAYDLFYGYIQDDFSFASLVFVDSGGYEASRDTELSDLGYTEHDPKEWSAERHRAELDRWPRSEIRSVFVSFDHPALRQPLEKQVETAHGLFDRYSGVARELLIKPETKDQRYVQIEPLLKRIGLLKEFDIIGFTEKELGSSPFDRMIAIARIRLALKKAKLDPAIHVFGSLDTISTPLYFLAGADIFDGLTWLRFAFLDGLTVYHQNFGVLGLGVRSKEHLTRGRACYANIYYLAELSMEMKRFLRDADFACFSHHSGLFRKAYQSLTEQLEI